MRDRCSGHRAVSGATWTAVLSEIYINSGNLE